MNILIVSKDAGGAEILSSWVIHHSHYHYFFILEQPALKIFLRKCVNIYNHSLDALDKILNKVDLVLTGTSNKPPFELLAIAKAKQKGIKTVSFLDHWVNYLARFQLLEQFVFPDEIWVGDEEAYRLAQTVLPAELIYLKENPYLVDMKNNISVSSEKISISEHAPENILYICEPIERILESKKLPLNYYGHNEFDVLNYFLEKVRTTYLKDSVKQIRIRLHPLEPITKYDGIISENRDFLLRKSTDSGLESDLSWAHWIVGMTSMALAVGVYVGKKVFCCLPSHSSLPRLPILGIRDLNSIL